MKSISQYFDRLLICLILCLLSSCFDGREEFWINANNSGRAEITYTLPQNAIRANGGEESTRAKILRSLSAIPNLTSPTCGIVSSNKRSTISIRFSFASALDLTTISTNPSITDLPPIASHLAGQITTHIQGRSLAYNRTISLNQALPGASMLPSSAFDGHQLVHILHLPSAATESNASRVEDSGRTLIWETPTLDAVHSPIVTRFVLPLPIPWSLVLTCSLCVILLLAFILFRVRKSRFNARVTEIL